MAHYEPPKPYYLKDRREVAIDLFASKSNISRADYMALGSIEQVEETLDIYRQEAGLMSRRELRNEEHDSKVLGNFMRLNGKPYPGGNCDAHAIVSGSHPRATQMRAILARVKIRIDDIRNGTWLPRRTADSASKHASGGSSFSYPQERLLHVAKVKIRYSGHCEPY